MEVLPQVGGQLFRSACSIGIATSTVGLALLLLLLACQGYGASETLGPDQHSRRFGDLSVVYVHEDSDWWSEIPKDVGGEPPGEFLAVRAERQNFRILGISVWGYSLNWPQQIVRTLGRATVIERGDAAFGRAQICYKSAGNSGQTKLIFETGECSESLYLFEGGPSFVGSDRCVSSMLVNESLKTPTGLGLGLTPAEVAKILGPPSATRRAFSVYKYNVKMRRTKEQIEAARREDPDPAPPDLGYDDSLSLVIRFRNGRSWYLYVTSGTC
jgi:hypothetical protein